MYRGVVREAMEEWNSLHAETSGVITLSVMWERDATPEMGDRAQGIINRQLVDVADVLIGIFWTQLGTPTSEAESGTAEEIERFIKAEKPVLLYFSSEAVALEVVDTEQLDRLTTFRTSLEKRGLIDRFASPDELRRKVTAALTNTIRENFANVTPEETAADEAEMVRRQRADLVAHVNRERELSGFSSTGTPRYSTRERLVVENRGTGVAEDLVLSFEASDESEQTRVPHLLSGDETVGRFPPGANLEYPMASFLGMVSQWDVVFRWREGEDSYEERQTLR
jgi:hypothetical protein